MLKRMRNIATPFSGAMVTAVAPNPDRIQMTITGMTELKCAGSLAVPFNADCADPTAGNGADADLVFR